MHLRLLFLFFFFFLFLLFTASVSAVVSLPMSFTSQAPFGNWSQPWQDFCEEAVIVMTDFYYAKKSLNPTLAREQLLRVDSIKKQSFGHSLDESAQTIVNLINDYYPWEAYVVKEPTIERIQEEIRRKQPVIIPAHGRFLFNPYFQDGGPEYHTVIISGYDEEAKQFIVQEPGTKHGLDFRYSYDTLMNAMHDYAPGPSGTAHGPKVAIFTRRQLSHSAHSDADNDGLIKKDELIYGTVLWLNDSDGDGYSDGDEIEHGYLPTLSEQNLPHGTLIKTENGPKVYFLETDTLGKKQKHHILNETVFFNRGWQWGQIILVSEGFLTNLPDGTIVK